MSNGVDDRIFNLVEGGKKVDLFLDENTIKARKIREGIPPLINPDGRPSTHLMTSGEVDGKFIAFPTLFPGYDTGKDTEEWGYLGTEEGVFPEEAYQEAKRRNEIFIFETDEEAKEFAKGSWKP